MSEVEIEIDLSIIRKQKIFLGIPMYGGQGAGYFMQSCMNLVSFATAHGFNITPFYIFNESLVTRARNYIADEFMRSDCTHLLFIDADIRYSHEDVLMLLHYSLKYDLDVTCGAYPKKNISWEKVKAAVDAGLADENPNVLSRYAGDYVFNPLPKEGPINLMEPMEVMESGTGFMLIKRDVMEQFVQTYPELRYYPDHIRTKDFGGDRKITGFFLDPIVDERHLSEDYFFCQWVRKMGRKIWILPWLKLDHFGSYNFEGDLISTLKANMSPTIKAEDIAKVKQ